MKYMGHRLTVRRYSRHIDHERTRGAPYCMVSGPAVLGEYVPVQGGPFAALLGACRWVSQRVKGRSR